MASTATPHKIRLEWLDALRGFTMIMVVANHVCGSAFFVPYKASASMQLLILFRMPLFFFISGFLAYKAGQIWDACYLWESLKKKFRIQTIPTIFFFLFAAAVLGTGFEETARKWLSEPMKGGYWFTIVLLYMFIVYYLYCYIEHLFTAKLTTTAAQRVSLIMIIVLFIISICFYETCYQPRYFEWAVGHKGPGNDFMDYTSLGQLFMYFPFFIYGNMVRRYWDKAQCIMDSIWFFPMLIVLVVFSALDSTRWHTLRMAWAIIPLTLARFSLLTMVFMYFRHYHQYFTKMTWIGRTFQYIGRRTLDIYLIHYLFLPNLPTIGSFFNSYRHNFVLDTTLAVLIAMIVIAFSVLLSNILRISPIFKKYLFGR